MCPTIPSPAYKDFFRPSLLRRSQGRSSLTLRLLAIPELTMTKGPGNGPFNLLVPCSNTDGVVLYGDWIIPFRIENDIITCFLCPSPLHHIFCQRDASLTMSFNESKKGITRPSRCVLSNANVTQVWLPGSNRAFTEWNSQRLNLWDQCYKTVPFRLFVFVAVSVQSQESAVPLVLMTTLHRASIPFPHSQGRRLDLMNRPVQILFSVTVSDLWL